MHSTPALLSYIQQPLSGLVFPSTLLLWYMTYLTVLTFRDYVICHSVSEIVWISIVNSG